jgi:hypothetical protein
MNTRQTFIITPRGPWHFQVVARGLAASVLCLVSLGLLGCQPKFDPKEYGEVITELPRVPGVEKPYLLSDPHESSDEGGDGEPTAEK